jgi:hypothetical protein
VAVTVRGGTPLVVATTDNPVSGTLNGARQPQAGDLLLIVHCNNFYALADMPNKPTVNGSADGVEEITGTGVPVDAGSNFGHIKPYLYKVTATGDVALSVTETGSADEDKGLVAYVLAGADLDNPIDDVVGVFSTASQADQELPGLSPGNAGGLLISHVNTMSGASAAQYEPPAGMSEVYDTKTPFMSLAGAIETLAASGPTGTRTFHARDADNIPQSVPWCGLQIVVKAAGSVVESTVNDTGGLTDTVGAAVSKPRTVDDQVGLSDEDDPLSTAVGETSADQVGMLDELVVSFSGAQDLAATVTDTAGVVDTVSTALAAGRSLQDLAGLTDMVSAQLAAGPPPTVGNNPQPGTVDLGDAVQLTFSTTPGATVSVSWWDPDGNLVIDHEQVPESPAGSGDFPYTYLPTKVGLWTAVFYAVGTATAVETYRIRVQPVPGPPPLATVDELEGLFRPMSVAEQAMARTLLRYASALLRARFPDLDARVAAGTLPADLAALAAIQMVLRVMRNPAGLPPLASVRVGPFSQSFFNDGAAGLLVITDAEEAILAPQGATVSPIGTVMARPGLARWPVGVRTARELRRWW